MKKILLLSMAAIMAAGTMQAKTADEVRIYLNPGHGSWGPNDRPMATIPYPALESGRPDTCGFYESNTNLWKILKMGETLENMGVKHENIMYSRVKNGPYPYVAGGEDAELYNRPLSEICREVDANNMDMFVSIHSNAHTDGSTTNYPLFLYRGRDGESGEGNAGSYAMCQATWGPRYMDELDPQSYYSRTQMNIRGDISFYGSSSTGTTSKGTFEGYLGVLKHGTPGYLLEGYFHTYQPARHRALNPDYCYQEGVRTARGLCDYFGLNPESTGYIMGTVKDLHEKIVSDLFKYAPETNDQWLPLNGATVNLLKDGQVVATYNVDNNYNGLFVFEGLQPGEYTLQAVAEGYKPQGTYTAKATSTEYQNLVAASLGTFTVEANATTYAKIYLENEEYVAPTMTYSNYPEHEVPGYYSLPETLAFGNTEATLEIPGTIKKAVAYGDSTVVLTDNNGTPELYLVNNTTSAIIKQMSTAGIEAETGNAGAISPLNDIDFTADGQLVGVNAVVCQYSNDQVDEGYTRGTVRVYKWQDADADPELWVTTQSSCNFYRSLMGKALTVSGSANDCHVMIAGNTFGGTTVRYLNLGINDNTLVSSVYSRQNAAMSETTMSENYNLVVSPQADDQFIVDGAGNAPIEFKQGANAVASEVVAEMSYTLLGDSASTVAAYGSSYFKWAGKTFMVTPTMSGANVTGVALVDATNGLANAEVYPSTGLELEAAETPSDRAAAAPVSFMAANAIPNGDNLNIMLWLDNTVVKFSTALAEQEAVKGIYAYGLNSEKADNQYTFTFTANDDAQAAKLVFTDANTGEYVGEVELSDIVKGENTVVLTTEEIPGEEGSLLNWAVTLTGKPINTIARLNSTTDNNTFARAFVAVDTYPESDYFGTMYAANRMGGNNARNGLWVLDENGERIGSDPYTGGRMIGSPSQITVAPDGKVLLADWSDPYSGVVVADPADFSTFTDFFAGTRASSGLWTNEGVNVGSSTPGIALGGEGADLKLYVYLEDFTPANGVGVYNIGNEDGTYATSWSTAPNNYFAVAGQVNTNGNLLAGKDGGFWVGQLRSKGNNTKSVPSLLYLDAEGNELFNSAADDWAENLNGSSNGGYAINNDGTVMVIADGEGTLQFFDLTWDGQTPVLTPKYSYSNVACAARSIKFDYAGNLILSGTTIGIYSMPTENNENTTPAKKALVVEKNINTGVDEVSVKDVKSVRYVNPAGMTSATPFDGVNIVITTYTDGSQKVTKVRK